MTEAESVQESVDQHCGESVSATGDGYSAAADAANGGGGELPGEATEAAPTNGTLKAKKGVNHAKEAEIDGLVIIAKCIPVQHADHRSRHPVFADSVQHQSKPLDAGDGSSSTAKAMGFEDTIGASGAGFACGAAQRDSYSMVHNPDSCNVSESSTVPSHEEDVDEAEYLQSEFYAELEDRIDNIGVRTTCHRLSVPPDGEIAAAMQSEDLGKKMNAIKDALEHAAQQGLEDLPTEALRQAALEKWLNQAELKGGSLLRRSARVKRAANLLMNPMQTTRDGVVRRICVGVIEQTESDLKKGNLLFKKIAQLDGHLFLVLLILSYFRGVAASVHDDIVFASLASTALPPMHTSSRDDSCAAPPVTAGDVRPLASMVRRVSEASAHTSLTSLSASSALTNSSLRAELPLICLDETGLLPGSAGVKTWQDDIRTAPLVLSAASQGAWMYQHINKRSDQLTANILTDSIVSGARTDVRLAAQTRALRSLKRGMDRRFEQIDGRFEQIDGRFERVDNKLNDMATTFNQGMQAMEKRQQRMFFRLQFFGLLVLGVFVFAFGFFGTGPVHT